MEKTLKREMTNTIDITFLLQIVKRGWKTLGPIIDVKLSFYYIIKGITLRKLKLKLYVTLKIKVHTNITLQTKITLHGTLMNSD
jgi:hypothetical protein